MQALTPTRPCRCTHGCAENWVIVPENLGVTFYFSAIKRIQLLDDNERAIGSFANSFAIPPTSYSMELFAPHHGQSQ